MGTVEAEPEITADEIEAFKERLRTDTPLWGREVGKILDKDRRIVPYECNPGQLAFDAKVEAQRLAGRPMRAVVLKARQIGFSTHIQGKLIQRATMTPDYHTAVVAHDKETGGKLYRIGQRFYSKLPEEIKPGIAAYRKGSFLHFGDKGDSWMEGEIWPDSSYYVDTANETEAGRGGTYAAIHGSEVAFWADFVTKLTALQSAVPDNPETMLFLESTANGHNDFKDFWDDAAAGKNEYLAFFWAWHQEPSYTLPFSNDWEREAFVIGDGNEGPIAEDEEDLIDRFGLSLEQLNWRRSTIRNKTLGRVDKFKQEYPSFPDEAFLTTGRRVFDPLLVQGILVSCDITDPRSPTKENPGPERGSLRAARTEMVGSQRGGRIERPEEPEWVPDPAGQWRLWHDREQMLFTPPPEKAYVIGVDVSGGEMKETSEPAWNAISVIDHETRDQVAEYRSREDDMLLAIEVYLAAKFFNDAWVAVEITGGWGLPVNRRLILDYGYPHCYHRTPLDNERGREQDLFGWDTNMRTKPIMVAGFQEQVREGTHGVKSRVLALEMQTYTREDTGKMKPSPGKFSDLLMAEMIAQQVATLMPIRRPVPRSQRRRRRVRDSVTGY